MRQADAVIIGGGPAGLAAAVELYHKGITDILILERESSLGGILKQCIQPLRGNLKRTGVCTALYRSGGGAENSLYYRRYRNPAYR